jgi:hypothetical protein
MKKLFQFSAVIFALVFIQCQDQLDIQNPNSPQFSNAKTETGLLNLAMGGVYTMQTKYSDQAFIWNWGWALHELMGDVIASSAANIGLNQIGCPDLVVLDNGAQVPNPQTPSTQMGFIRQRNLNQNGGNNPLVYEWAIMYSLNNASNMVLSYSDEVQFSGDPTTQATKRGTVKAWAYFWKGFAYSRIGSLYYAGIVNNEVMLTNNDYVTKEDIVTEANLNLGKADSVLNHLTQGGAYDEVLQKLIPSICQVGKGVIPTPSMWKRHINTLRARNILVNRTVTTMTAADWNDILNLTVNGIQQSDNIFTVRSNGTADLMSANGGNVPAQTRVGSWFTVSERLIQDFKLGDNRLPNNFIQGPILFGDPGRGNSFNTRWQLINGGAGMPGVAVMQDRTVGAYELYMAGFYEENELMKAEANIYLGSVDAGLAIIDNIRVLQGAGLAAVSGTGLSQAQAIDELRSERRVALAFRGLSFYDARRYDLINTGRTGAVVVDDSGVVNTNATIRYNFLDYWDVPDNELKFNPPNALSAPVKNPNGL